MPNISPQYAFVAGEVSPEFFGRTDLVKYSLGVGLAKNWFVGYRGGMYTRVGSRFVGELMDDDKDIKLFRFEATGNDYVLVFGDNYMRVVRNGGYILESGQAITGATQADPGVLTITGHSFTTGDWAFLDGIGGMTELNKRLVEIGTTTVNTVELLLPDGTNLDTSAFTAYTSGGTASKVFTLTTPYAAEDLSSLRVEQELEDTVTVFKLTHVDYAPRKLTYTNDTTWSIAEISFGNTVPSPTNLALNPSSAGTAGVAFAVTALVGGIESQPSAYEITELTVDYTLTAGSMEVTWDAVTDATEYYVYRSLMLPTGSDISLAQEVGYIGRALSSRFVDNNIIPDFTKTPPLHLNPFADSTITFIEVTAGGTGYAKSDTVTVSGGGGSGFVGYPVVDASGTILSVVIINGGEGYSSPVVTFNTSGGSGATATATVGAASGNNPAVYKKFQQRGVYAGTNNFPMTIWGSKPGKRENFDISVTINAGDSYEFELDESSIQPIEHLVALRSGLLVFTSKTVTQLRAEQGKSISPVDALAEPQVYKGISAAEPVNVDLDVIFAQRFSNAVNAMVYTEYTNAFQLQNLSLLSDHLIGPEQQILRMEYAEEPDKIIYCLREDGVMLSLTYDRNEEVFGWAQLCTKGLYKDMVALQENSVWKVYTVVERFINGAWRKFIELQDSRTVDLVEDYAGSDSFLDLEHIEPAAQLTIPSTTGTGVTVEASASVFASGNVGDIIYAGGGKLEVTAFTSGTEITCDILREITDVVCETSPALPKRQPAGDWSIATPVVELSGLWHLEGESLSVLADGDVYLEETVTNGKITIDTPATKIIAGLPYECDLQTLPVISTQGIVEISRKKIEAAGMRLHQTRGLSIGPDFDSLVEMKDLTDEDWGEILKLRNETVYEELEDNWDVDGVFVLRQSYPLPAAVLNLFVDFNNGAP